MLAYKAFDKDLSCTSGGNRYQYKLGEWNEEQSANCARNGFHCAENPLDCLTYYPNFDKARYFVVEAAGDIDEDNTDTKIACTRMKLIRELTLEDFVLEALKYIVAHPGREVSGIYKNSLISKEERRNHFAIVRGKNPEFKGPIGTVIGLIQEGKKGTIVAAGMTRVRTSKMVYRIVGGKIKECEADAKEQIGA